VTGATGPTGANGTSGADGTNGANGTNGENGVTGATGPTGATGANGTNGTEGANGSNGSNGSNGANGTNGANGANGTNGTNGPTGATGATGSEAPLTWHVLESTSFETGVEDFTQEVENTKYAPLSWAVGGNGEVYLRGVLKNTVDLSAGKRLFTLPLEAAPHFRQALWIGNAGSANLTGGDVVVVQPNGEVKTPAALAKEQDPTFDGVQFSTAE
jgi:hypothetical protein